MGRIVNFYDQAMNSKMPQAAKGCLKIVVKDDTGAFGVRHSLFLFIFLFGEGNVPGIVVEHSVSDLWGRSSSGTPKSTISFVSVISFQSGHHMSPMLSLAP